jgi:hypothetical protein
MGIFAPALTHHNPGAKFSLPEALSDYQYVVRGSLRETNPGDSAALSRVLAKVGLYNSGPVE